MFETLNITALPDVKNNVTPILTVTDILFYFTLSPHKLKSAFYEKFNKNIPGFLAKISIHVIINTGHPLSVKTARLNIT